MSRKDPAADRAEDGFPLAAASASVSIGCYGAHDIRAHQIKGVLMTDVAAERRRVRALIERAGVAILMNVDERGSHVGRPMLPLFVQKDPDIYFLTHQSSRKVIQLAARPQVGLTIISANCYFVMAGSAHLSRDPQLIRRLWSPTYRAWFPEGKDDPEATVIRVVVERLDYWEPPGSRVIRIAQAVKAMVTRRPVDTPMKTLDRL